jgi:hypothetical protein
MPVGEPAEQVPGDEAPGPADTAETEDAAVEAMLRELFRVPGANDAAESHVALVSWCRLPGML